MKRTFYKILRNSKIESCELYTTLIELEGTINNRPLTYAYHETDAEMLTPAHLMYGYRFDMIPDDLKEKTQMFGNRRKDTDENPKNNINKTGAVLTTTHSSSWISLAQRFPNSE